MINLKKSCITKPVCVVDKFSNFIKSLKSTVLRQNTTTVIHVMFVLIALSILHQHAIQGDMSELQLAAVRWLAYSRAHPSVDPRVLYKLLASLENIWPTEVLSREEVTSCIQ